MLYFIMIFFKKIWLSTATLVAVFSFLIPGQIFAEGNSGCGITPEQIEQLKDLQANSSPNAPIKISEELGLRKSLLKLVVSCATKEAEDLKQSLSDIKISDQEVRFLQNQFLPWFSDVLNYYKLESNKINDLGLQGSKDFAKNFQTWRDGNFRQTAKIVSTFILWSQNQELIQIAQNRLSQMKRGVDVFGLGLNEEIRNDLSGAEEKFNKSKSLNNVAKDIIKTYGSSDEAIVITKQSLDALSTTYEKLIDLAQKINKALIK